MAILQKMLYVTISSSRFCSFPLPPLLPSRTVAEGNAIKERETEIPLLPFMPPPELKESHVKSILPQKTTVRRMIIISDIFLFAIPEFLNIITVNIINLSGSDFNMLCYYRNVQLEVYGGENGIAVNPIWRNKNTKFWGKETR